MTEKEFTTKRFRHSELLIFNNGHLPPVECLLTGIDFEKKLIQLIPIDFNYEPEEFWSKIDYVYFPLPKLKIAK